MKLSSIPPEVVTYHVLHGRFDRVHYFAASIDLQDAAENLMLFPQESLGFQERIQRVLNEGRVENELLPYLKTDPLRFFSSIVCVIVPRNDSQMGYWDFEPYQSESGNPLNIGQLKVRKDVFRVVLDGQHRFRALQLFWTEQKQQLLKRAQKIDVPLLFITIDGIGKVGDAAQTPKTKTIECVRRIFSVINKTAKNVDKNTLLLIDDSDLTNVIARRLIEADIVREEFVKWAGSDSLRDDDPFFTTIQNVRDIVRTLLGEFSQAIRHVEDTVEQQKALLRDYFEQPKIGPAPLSQVIKTIFDTFEPLERWKELMSKAGVGPIQQPQKVTLTKRQIAMIAKARKTDLAYTVAGQKALLRSIASTYIASPLRSTEALVDIVEKHNAITRAGLFVRKATKGSSTNPFAGVLFDHEGNMLWADSCVELARQILSQAAVGKLDKASILERYRVSTGFDPHSLECFWDKFSSRDDK